MLLTYSYFLFYCNVVVLCIWVFVYISLPFCGVTRVELANLRNLFRTGKWSRSWSAHVGSYQPNILIGHLVLVACGLQIFSTNNTDCGHLLEEIKCARCSPNAQMLFHSLDMDKVPHREPDLPRLCLDFCREFYYTCRGHIPGNYTDNNDNECDPNYSHSVDTRWLASKHTHMDRASRSRPPLYLLIAVSHAFEIKLTLLIVMNSNSQRALISRWDLAGFCTVARSGASVVRSVTIYLSSSYLIWPRLHLLLSLPHPSPASLYGCTLMHQ